MKPRNLLLIEYLIHSADLAEQLIAQNFALLTINYNDLSPDLLKNIQPDVLIINQLPLNEPLLINLKTINEQSPVAVIFLSQEDNAHSLTQLLQAQVCEIISPLLPIAAMRGVIELALVRFQQQQILKTALSEARTQLEDRKLIDRAKSILMKTQRVDEDCAYHTLRKLAMDRNITLGAMAKQVIAMAQLLK